MYWALLFPILFASASVYAQDPDRVRIANLEQDVRDLMQTVRQLRMDVEHLTTENQRLQQEILAQRAAQANLAQQIQGYVTLEQLRTTRDVILETLRQEESNAREMLAESFNKELEKLALRVQQALETLSASLQEKPAAEQVVVFTEDYPTTGIVYTVKSGDSLGAIAKRFNSRLSWIRNANRIAGDIIHPGDELFIPQEN